MDIEEIACVAERIAAGFADLGALARQSGAVASDVGHNVAPEGDGFVVLPVARFDELRQSEEDLRDVRVAAPEPAAPLTAAHLGDIHGEILRIKDRAEEFDRRLRSFCARLAELEELLETSLAYSRARKKATFP